MRLFPTELVASNGAFAQREPRRGTLHREPKTIRREAVNNRATMAAGLFAPSAYPVARFNFIESVIGYDALLASAYKCFKNVGHKFSTQSYSLDVIQKTVNLSNDLTGGRYKEGRTHIVNITYPKPRTALAISFRDRVVQRSINDVALYPQVTKSFIWANFACQKGKGTDAARNYYKRILHNAWLKWRTNKFKIVEFDIKGCYDSMVHSVTDRIFAEKCDEWTASVVSATLAKQYKGDVGYNPGSQMVQIAGIAYLDKFDHYVKEALREKYYLHYMDDGRIIIAPDADEKELLGKIAAKLAEVGLKLHPKKTQVVTADKGGLFLGFIYRVTETGKVLMLRDPAQVKAIRRKYRRLANRVKCGRSGIEDLDNSYRCVRSFMSKGNSRRLIRRMDDFVENLKKEVANA